METNSIVRVPLRKVLTNTININHDKEYLITKGAKSNTWQRFPAQSVSNTQITVNCNPPSRDVVVNSRAYVRCKYNIVINGTAGASGKMIQPGLDGPRFMPLARSINTLQVTIGGDNFSTSLNQYWPAVSKYFENKNAINSGFMTTTPNMADQYQEYADFLNPITGGSARNALAGYGENGYMEGRSGFSGFKIISDEDGSAVCELDVTEPVFCSPFNFSDQDRPGLIGISEMSMIFSFSELASSVWSHNNTTIGHSVINNLIVNITEFELLFNYQSLPLEMSSQLRPTYSYPYYEMIPYSTKAQEAPPQAVRTVTMNSIQLGTIPRRCYIFLREENPELLFSNGGCNKTDTFAVINNISITFNNKTGLLSTASIDDLYRISASNGCDMSYSQWTKYQGSVLALDFSKDLSLDDLLASGSRGSFNFSCTVNYTNPRQADGRSVKYQLWCVCVNEGIINVVNGMYSHQIGVFEAEDVINVPIDTSLSWTRSDDIYGGSFIMSLIPKIMKGVRFASPFIKKGLRYGPQVADFMENTLGLGGALTGAGTSGGYLTGGARLSRRSLEDRIMN